MSINFFDPVCREPSFAHEEFGVCDNGDGGKAYTDVNNPSKWIATVLNSKKIELTFTAIDKCVIKDNEEIRRERCDGMLTSAEHIYFIELNDSRSSWISGSIQQLESTIKFFNANHDINKYRHKKAFACNKHRSHFQEIDNEFNLQFFRKYKVRIDVQAEIIIL